MKASEPQLALPKDDVENPLLSIVIPTMNEEVAISKFLIWCREGIANLDIEVEILIVDSSSDSTPEIAVSGGARVLRVPPHGLGQAYKDAIPFIRGKWVLMGDADCTYDFRDLKPFVEAFKEGHEFVMGSRWKGSIEEGSMPPHHRYFGTPLTTWILNRLFKSNFSDIHCGMRGITLEALKRIQLISTSWEYASEMVLKSVQYRLKTIEVPVHFYKDLDGRVSHHKRSGWFSPFSAAWINLRAMFVFGADFFLQKPGLVLSTVGTLGVLTLIPGPVEVGRFYFSIFWMLVFAFLGLMGAQLLLLSQLAKAIHDVSGEFRTRAARKFRYTRTTVISALLALTGIIMSMPLIINYLANSLSLARAHRWEQHLAIGGLYFSTLSFLLFAAMLVLHAIIQKASQDTTADDLSSPSK